LGRKQTFHLVARFLFTFLRQFIPLITLYLARLFWWWCHYSLTGLNTFSANGARPSWISAVTDEAKEAPPSSQNEIIDQQLSEKKY